ncbi:hypothetical protein E2C01_016251 [Portunus trituberculatus]|uniref:Uncharacterized protein n=1 Tax=Portunus trituberculatus TaxID=210409 RepID=A0A5B7DNL7_PORTR|nr:hypothetical protein [Portunus trituberculatus]
MNRDNYRCSTYDGVKEVDLVGRLLVLPDVPCRGERKVLTGALKKEEEEKWEERNCDLEEGFLKSALSLPLLSDEATSAGFLKGAAEHAHIVLGAVGRVGVVAKVLRAIEVSYLGGLTGLQALSSVPGVPE